MNSSSYYAAHHRTQPPPDAEFPYWLAQPHSFHSAVQPWHQTYQFGVPLWEEPTRHSLPPRPNTQPWQQPPDPPDWQHNPQPQQSASQAGGRTKPTSYLPTISDPVLSPAADSPPLDEIRTMFEHLFASMARLEARMDDFLGLHEGFRQNPNGQSSSLRQPAILPIAVKPPGLPMKPPHFDGPLQQHTYWDQHQEPVLDPPPPQTLLSRCEQKVADNRESVNPVEESESDSSEEGSSSSEESDADLDPTPPQNRPQPQIPAAKPSQPLPIVSSPQVVLSTPCSLDTINTAVQHRGKSSILDGEIGSIFTNQGTIGRIASRIHTLIMSVDYLKDINMGQVKIFWKVTFAYDPGGITREACYWRSSLCRGSHLEDKVDFNRGGVDTCKIYKNIPHINI